MLNPDEGAVHDPANSLAKALISSNQHISTVHFNSFYNCRLFISKKATLFFTPFLAV